MEKDPEKALILEVLGRQFKINMIEYSREYGQLTEVLGQGTRELEESLDSNRLA